MVYLSRLGEVRTCPAGHWYRVPREVPGDELAALVYPPPAGEAQ